MIAALEAPAELVRGEIFNVLHSNYQIRELAMLVAGSVQLLGRTVRLEEAGAAADSRLRVLEREARARPWASSRRGRWSMAITDLLASIDATDRTMLTDPRHYNIRWLELMHEVTPRIEKFGSVL